MQQQDHNNDTDDMSDGDSGNVMENGINLTEENEK